MHAVSLAVLEFELLLLAIFIQVHNPLAERDLHIVQALNCLQLMDLAEERQISDEDDWLLLFQL